MKHKHAYGALLRPAYIAVSTSSSILLALGLLGALLPVALTQQWMGRFAGPVGEYAGLLIVLGLLLGAVNFVMAVVFARKPKR